MSMEPVPDFPLDSRGPAPAGGQPQPERPGSAAGAEGAPRRTRLSIAHLLLWTLGTAMVLAASRAQLSAFDLPQFDQRPFASSLGTYLRVMAMVTAPFNGIAVALLLLAMWRLYRRRPLPLKEPGHWLLLIFGALFLLNAGMQLASLAVRWEAASSVDVTLLVIISVAAQLIVVATAAGLCWLAWRGTSGPPRWRFVFASSFVFCAYWIAAAALGAASLILGEFSMFVVFPLLIVSLPVTIAWLISFPSAVIQDLLGRQRFGALHWAGVAVVIVNVLAGIASVVIPAFLVRG